MLKNISAVENERGATPNITEAPKEIRTAASADVSRLFHYQPGNLLWLEDLFLRNRIWFSDPAGFNDIHDFHPQFDTDLQTRAERDRHLSFLLEADKKYYPKPRRQRRAMKAKLRHNPSVHRALTRKIASEIPGEMARRYRVYCTSTESKLPKMWSLYADNHKGVCLEFATDNSVFCGALEVQYLREPPILVLGRPAETDALTAFVAKPDVWSNEREYRLVAQEKKYALPHDTLITNDNWLQIPPNALRGIIFGCAMKQEHQKEIETLVKKVGKDIQVARASPTEKSYDLSILPVSS